MRPWRTVEKAVGETPLEALERLRSDAGIPKSVPLAYAGRLDPMASGTLLVLIGEECKRQQTYHTLDKEYQCEVLFGVHSDSGDVLGITECEKDPPQVRSAHLRRVLHDLLGPTQLPYPHFSSKTVRGKPLHTWTLENRLDEITIPFRTSTIYKLTPENMHGRTGSEIRAEVLEKIKRLPLVTDPKKAIGRDFRRDEVLASWKHLKDTHADTYFQIMKIRCICSSGMYMRSLAEEIARRLGTVGLAYSIHRTRIGAYWSPIRNVGFWTKVF